MQLAGARALEEQVQGAPVLVIVFVASCLLTSIVLSVQCYLYMDEAHSIGAMGATGRGIVEYYNMSPNDVDVLMGTFTKSFGSCGGYVAASRVRAFSLCACAPYIITDGVCFVHEQQVIDYLRSRSAGLMYTTAMSPGTAQQGLTALNIMMGEGGTTEGTSVSSAMEASLCLTHLFSFGW